MTFTYDTANRLTQVVNSALGLPLLRLGYSLDKVGNRTSLAVDGIATAFAYDPLNELVSAQLGPLKTTWTYDQVGNRLKEAAPNGTTNYAYDAADRILSAGSTTFLFDANGNMISRTGSKPLQLAYDAANRLIRATGTGINSGYAYDGDGNRVIQTTNAGSYAYVNDINSSLPVVLAEQGPDGALTYAYGLGLIEEAGPSFNNFYHFDGLGSVVALTDGSGRPEAAYAYDSWGNSLLSISDSVGTKNKFRFTGEALDPGTGLYFLRARYYDSANGRFLTRDPLAASLNPARFMNMYQYASSNPMRFVDPTGRFLSLAEDFAKLTQIFDQTTQQADRFDQCTLNPELCPNIGQQEQALNTSVGQLNTQATKTGIDVAVETLFNPSTYGLELPKAIQQLGQVLDLPENLQTAAGFLRTLFSAPVAKAATK